MKDHAELANEWLQECVAALKSDGQTLQAFIRASRSDHTLLRGLFDLFSEDSDATVRTAMM